MKILVINTGSSSIKYKLFDMDRHQVLASGLAEKIGETSGELKHAVFDAGGQTRDLKRPGFIPDHNAGLIRIVDLLLDPEWGVIARKSDIAAVGHRVVHGGETFQAPTRIDEAVLNAVRKHTPLAPLHNPPNLTGINVALSIFPDAPQVAVFDTAFHQTMPPRAFLYALPYELYEREGVRRYGFHGTSHAYVAEIFARHVNRPLEGLDLITIHLGNGASMAALKNGKCVDTTMGMTPLEGLVMGTRCGDTDPALPFFLADHLGMSLKEIDGLLNKASGLKGICGANDMREVLHKRDAGDPRAQTALDIYCYRIKKYIGAYYAVLGRLDGLVFTAGIGENSPEIRMRCCDGLDRLGIKVDPVKNTGARNGILDIGCRDQAVTILVVPTDEEFKIAQETIRVLESSYGNTG